MPHTPEIRAVIISIQAHSETQLYIARIPENLKTKALGFTQFLFDVTFPARVYASVAFRCLGGMRSTQPTVLRCVFS